MTIQCLPVQGRGWLERSQAIGMGLSALWHCPFPPDKSGSEVCWEHGCTYRSVSLQGEKCTEAWKAEEFQAQCGSLQCLKPLLYCGPCFPAACSESLGTLGQIQAEIRQIIPSAHPEFLLPSDCIYFRSLGAQANSTPATVPATSARVPLLVSLYCRRARAFW